MIIHTSLANRDYNLDGFTIAHRHHVGHNKCRVKSLLIFDGASSHLDVGNIDTAEAHDFVLYFLPSNTTHELK